MDANSIVNKLGSMLMSSEQERIQGKNQSLYAEPLDKVLNPYRKAWMKEHLAKFATRHKTGAVGKYEVYEKILDEIEKASGLIYQRREKNSNKIVADVYVIKHRTIPLPNGYAQWEPQIALEISRRKDGAATISISFEGETFPLMLNPKEFKDFLERLCTLPLGCEKRILRPHYMEYLPEDLRDKYAHVTINEAMGRSSHSDGAFYYGHEVELRTNTRHKFRYAYIPEYLWDYPDTYDTIHNTIRSAYAAMEKLSALLPGLAIVSDHADDCGVYLTKALSSKLARLMDKISAWSEGKQVTLKVVEEVIAYFGMDPNVVPPKDVLADYLKGKKSRDIKITEVKSVLDPQKNGWPLITDWDEMKLYVSGPREWRREVYVAIPYDCPKETYSKILEAKDALAEFCTMMTDCRDYFTSIGMYPKEPLKR